MNNQREEITSYLGRALFVVLFFLAMVVFSDQSVKQGHLPVKVQSMAEMPGNSVITDAIQLPLFQRNLVSIEDRMSFQLYNATFKRFDDNRVITQRFVSLQQTEFLIKPLTECRFYYHILSKDTGEVPILG
jgi:hypothetical protein